MSTRILGENIRRAYLSFSVEGWVEVNSNSTLNKDIIKAGVGDI